MLNNLFAKPKEIIVGEQTLKFSSLAAAVRAHMHSERAREKSQHWRRTGGGAEEGREKDREENVQLGRGAFASKP